MVLHELTSRLQGAGCVLLVCGTLWGCSPEQPELGAANGGGAAVASGNATALSDGEFQAMTVDEQYRIVNKLMGTLYKGIPVDEFYELSNGLMVSEARSTGTRLSDIRAKLSTELDVEEINRIDTLIVGDPNAVDESGMSAPIEPAYYFDSNQPKQMPLARITHYPLSKNGFSQWMSWHLANTILFSPAEEIDSADILDVQNLFRRLDTSIMNGQSIRQIIATHQRTVENWRRFRSPEDNTREMMEIYLGLFDKDDEVPKASKACQDLYLSDERSDYKLVKTDFPNTEAQLVLGKYVVDCNEFYDAVATHPLLIPRVTSVLVDYFFAGHSDEARVSLTRAIANSNPVTFDDIFLNILFSKTYLLNTERPKSFEESYMGMAARLKWDAHPDVFRGMTGGRGSLSRTDMSEMGWPSMSLKLGRAAGIPLDSLSFANYHKALRESLMLDRWRWSSGLGLARPDAPQPEPIEHPGDDASARELAAYEAELAEYQSALAELPADERAEYDRELALYETELARYRQIEEMTVAELIDYLFLTVIQRRASEKERLGLTDILLDNGHLDEEFSNAFVRSGRMDDSAIIVMDYLSRLPEGYYMPIVR